MTDPHRLGQITGMDVVGPDGRRIGHVNDVRISRGERSERTTIIGIIVGQRNTGALLGYDRNRAHGPWMIRTLVRWLHRKAIYVAWSDVTDIDWAQQRLSITGGEHTRLLDAHNDDTE